MRANKKRVMISLVEITAPLSVGVFYHRGKADDSKFELLPGFQNDQGMLESCERA